MELIDKIKQKRQSFKENLLNKITVQTVSQSLLEQIEYHLGDLCEDDFFVKTCDWSELSDINIIEQLKTMQIYVSTYYDHHTKEDYYKISLTETKNTQSFEEIFEKL